MGQGARCGVTKLPFQGYPVPRFGPGVSTGFMLFWHESAIEVGPRRARHD
jgi:hypothetical protein